jgi:Ca-activated chloride channel family protein
LDESWQCIADLPQADTDNPELERLWALSSIHDAMQTIREKGESESLRKKIVDLGLNYSLVTDYTSMVVVRHDVMENLGIQGRNAQRVARERKAQQARAAAPVRNHTADNGKMFHGAHSPGIGSGPVGPGLLGLIFWFSRRKRKAQ